MKLTINIKGIDLAFYNQNFEAHSFKTCVAELIDNAIDAGSTKINIELKNDSLVITDDGKGLSPEVISKIFDQYTYESPAYSNDSIGCRGVGLKSAILALISGDSTATIKTVSENRLSTLVWNIQPSTNVFDGLKLNVEETNNNKPFTTIEITNIRAYNVDSLRKFISLTYSDAANTKGISITLNGKKIEFIDIMHLNLLRKRLNASPSENLIDVLNNNIEKDTAFYIENKIFYCYKLQETNTWAISLAITNVEESGKLHKNSKEEVSINRGGVNALKGSRYITVASDPKLHIRKGCVFNGGGAGRTRHLILITNENANIFKVQQNKSNGIGGLIDCLEESYNSDLVKIEVVNSELAHIRKNVDNKNNFFNYTEETINTLFNNVLNKSNDDNIAQEIKRLANSRSFDFSLTLRTIDKKYVFDKENDVNMPNTLFKIIEKSDYVSLTINLDSKEYLNMFNKLKEKLSTKNVQSSLPSELFNDLVHTMIQTIVENDYKRVLSNTKKNNDKLSYAEYFNKKIAQMRVPALYKAMF